MFWPPGDSTSCISFLFFWPLSLLVCKHTEDDPSVGPDNLDVTYVPLANLSLERHQWQDGMATKHEVERRESGTFMHCSIVSMRL